jgi:hypothetical protein
MAESVAIERVEQHQEQKHQRMPVPELPIEKAREHCHCSDRRRELREGLQGAQTFGSPTSRREPKNTEYTRQKRRHEHRASDADSCRFRGFVVPEVGRVERAYLKGDR